MISIVLWSLIAMEPVAFQAPVEVPAPAATASVTEHGPSRLAPASDEAQRVYNTLFPYYAEICTVSQYRRRGEKPGGTGGHATMFLHGAEIQRDSGYPRLQLVSESADLAEPNSGVGISVNKVFANANWVAIPGRRMFFRGGLAPDQPLDQTSFDAAVRQAVESTWFNGIALHPEYLSDRQPDMPIAEHVVRKSIGTDFALNFARNAHCSRIPLERARLALVLEHLNGLNDRARIKGYHWNLYTNNCSHILHNALAAAGVWDRKEIRGSTATHVVMNVLSVIKGLFGGSSDFSFPANNFVRLYEAGNERPIDDVFEAFDNGDIRRSMSDGWISTGPGSLVMTYPMLGTRLNEMFDEGSDPFIFSVPLIWNKKDKFRELTRSPPAHIADARTNLQYYRERFARIMSTRNPAERDSYFKGDRRRAFAAFYDRYYEYVDMRLREVDELIAVHTRLAGEG